MADALDGALLGLGLDDLLLDHGQWRGQCGGVQQSDQLPGLITAEALESTTAARSIGSLIIGAAMISESRTKAKACPTLFLANSTKRRAPFRKKCNITAYPSLLDVRTTTAAAISSPATVTRFCTTSVPL
jgi:hypothetical protein